MKKSDPAVFSGSYADLRFVRSRKVAQVTIEIAIEEAARFVATFGAPNPAAEVPVAIARLLKTAGDDGRRQAPVSAEATGAPSGERWRDMPPSRQAGILCREGGFRRFMQERLGVGLNADTPEEAAERLRAWFGVGSRRDLNDEARAQSWRDLEARYRAWLAEPAHV